MKDVFFTGGYTKQGKGIYVCEWDRKEPQIFVKNVEERCENPNFITVHRGRQYLLALNENEMHTWITLFTITDRENLTLKDRIEIGGKGPCHISTDETGDRVFYANYESGEIGMVRIRKDGTFDGKPQGIFHKGHSIGPRQKSPHPHGVHVLPGQKLVVPDLGTDEVWIYDIRTDVPEAEEILTVKPGDGPRHAVLHPDGRALYIICELENVIYTYIQEQGRWKEKQRISLLEQGMAGEFIGGEIAVTPDGKWLFASTRTWGENQEEEGFLTVFKTKDDGCLKFVRMTGSCGSHPRMFTITDDGNYILAANQYTGNLVGLMLNHENAELKLCCSAEIPEITCVICN